MIGGGGSGPEKRWHRWKIKDHQVTVKEFWLATKFDIRPPLKPRLDLLD